MAPRAPFGETGFALVPEVQDADAEITAVIV